MTDVSAADSATAHPVMVDGAEALALIAQHTPALTPQRTRVADALGHVAGEAVTAPIALQPFDNSAMDGFALRAADVARAGAGAAVTLPVRGHTAAGPVGHQHAPDAACAWEIMTGAPVPAGFDAVVPVEKVWREAGTIRLEAAVEPGANIRRAGEDYAPGDPVIDAGDAVTPERLMALHALGIESLLTRRPPRVAVIATGAELVDDPARALEPGEIHDSNRPYLAAWLRAAGMEVTTAVTVGDDPEGFARTLAAALDTQPDVVLTSGAVSAGVHDFIPAALLAAGARIRFHKARIRPAKPLLYATLADGTACFGLPGNPLSVAVGLRFFVVSCLRALQGLAPEACIPARLVDDWHKPAQMTFYGKGRIAVDDQGRLSAKMLEGQQSFRIRPLTRANGWIVLPPGAQEVAAGTLVEVAPLGPTRDFAGA